MKDIKGKLILITGGSNGIGRLMCLDFAARGGRVVAWGRNQKALADLEKEAREKGFFIKGMVCDVSDRAAVYKTAAALTAELGPVDVLVNNAGIVSGSPFLETPDEKVINTINVNTLASFWTCRAFLPSMIGRNSGHVVVVSSAAGIVGVTGLADYCASKFAAFGFTEAIRMELRRLKCRVKTTVVCPFFIDTGMFQGVKTRFPLLFPILKQDAVARKIVRGVLKNKPRLILPPLVVLIFLLRMFPVKLFDAVVDFLGVNKAMDKFVGRKG
jgi:all-trans-retinol dehydrogenase (NAD+)